MPSRHVTVYDDGDQFGQPIYDGLIYRMHHALRCGFYRCHDTDGNTILVYVATSHTDIVEYVPTGRRCVGAA